MSHDSARSYFERLATLLERVEITDATGGRIELDRAATRTVERLLDCRRANKKVLLIGNGGSAAIVSHMQSNFARSVGMRAMVFHETPYMTTIANVDGYNHVFSQPLALWAEPGDVLVAVSSSGRCENVVRAAHDARARGAEIVTLTGFANDNPLRALGLLNFWIDSDAYGLVEAAHSAITHYLTERASVLARRSQTAP